MSAIVRYQKLQRKALGYEAAGLTSDPEYQRVKNALAETGPYLTDAEKATVGLGETKVAESVDAGEAKVAEDRKPKAKKDKEASAMDVLSDQEQGEAAPAASN